MQYRKLERLVKLLCLKKLTIVFAESMTAGLAASELGRVPGVSSTLLGSIVTYSSELKTSLLGVSRRKIKTYTAESFQVTEAMAMGLKKKINADISVAITGVASAPVNDYKVKHEKGEAFICIFVKNKKFLYSKKFSGSRNEVRQKTVDFIFEELYRLIN